VRVLKKRCTAIAAGCALLFPHISFAGSADDYAAYKFQYFSDNNDVQVRTSAITFSKAIGNRTIVAGSYLVDAITAASKVDSKGGSPSVDAITSASRIDEQRHQVSGTVSFNDDMIKKCRQAKEPEKESDDPTGISVTGMYSTEPDYTSKSGSLSLRQDLFSRNTVLEFSFGSSFDQFLPAARYVPPLSDEGWNYFGGGRRRTDRISGGCTQIITSTTLASLTGEYVFDRGYLSRPYYVYEITDTSLADTIHMFYHENLPPERKCAALSAHVARYFPVKRGASLHCDYRFYHDSWKIESHTIALKCYYRFADHLIFNPHYRFYSQTAASFYKDIYTDVPEYLTADFKLGSFTTNTIGLKLIFELEDFMKPVDNASFALFPVSFDIAANYMMRSGTKDAAIRDSHYSYWPVKTGYRNFWIQTGIRCAF
jgi:hypothetical protein